MSEEIQLADANLAHIDRLRELLAYEELRAADAERERDTLKGKLHDLRRTIIRMRDSGHELPGSLMVETFEWESSL